MGKVISTASSYLIGFGAGFIGLLLILAIIGSAEANEIKIPQKESFYATEWCDSMSGKQEVDTRLGTRVDCLTDEYAVEVDFDYKWAEALGQSLHYGVMMQKQPAILLIINDHTERAAAKSKDYVERLQKTIKGNKLPVVLFTISVSDYPLRSKATLR